MKSEWARNNREKSRKQSQNYYWAHKDERNAASKKWRDEHKLYNARMRAYRKRKRKKKQALKPLNLARFSGFFCL